MKFCQNVVRVEQKEKLCWKLKHFWETARAVHLINTALCVEKASIICASRTETSCILLTIAKNCISAWKELHPVETHYESVLTCIGAAEIFNEFGLRKFSTVYYGSHAHGLCQIKENLRYRKNLSHTYLHRIKNLEPHARFAYLFVFSCLNFAVCDWMRIKMIERKWIFGMFHNNMQ